MKLLVIFLLAAGVVVSAARLGQSATVDLDPAVKLSNQWLSSRDPAERKRLAAKLSQFDGDPAPVIARLSSRSFKSVMPGYIPEEHFSQSELCRKHPDDLLYFVVPKSYRPDRPTGLIVFLHGGGRTTTRRAPQATLNFPASDSPPDTHHCGDMFAATGMITVGPSAPRDTESAHRWCLATADEYLADVIDECKSRFNIDPDRVVLLGHSMGGFGAFQPSLLTTLESFERRRDWGLIYSMKVEITLAR
jgi:acetyl esterase/lipase